MSYSIQQLEGIGPVQTRKLHDAGVTTTDQLLAACGSASGRASFAGEHGMDEAELLRYANLCDLMRVSGVGEEYSDLLEAAGVDTVKELRNRDAANLTAAMAEKNAERPLVRVLPTESEVVGWISQAKELEPRVTH